MTRPLSIILCFQLPQFFCISVVRKDDNAYMSSGETPSSGPSLATAYVPGTPGANWTGEEVSATRRRILQAIDPDWDVKKAMYGNKYAMAEPYCNGCTLGQISENTLMQLAFHDCFRYTDGTGGCDGCLDWTGVGDDHPNIFNDADTYAFQPANATTNNGLDSIVEVLELIYTTVDWPFKIVSMNASLQQLGKSRADLWQLAGLVALERGLERANRACDLDFHARQQVTLLESRDACEVKLTKPLKFKTGRSDCVSEDTGGKGYKASKAENEPRMFGDANHATDFFKSQFNMDAEHSSALEAIHGAVHKSTAGVKYTWWGIGYISNMYFKLIANKPIYKWEQGGDLSFGKGRNVFNTSQGDTDGNPLAMIGWRASCMYSWNTPEGGPCFLRPIPVSAADAPNASRIIYSKCVSSVDDEGKCVIDTSLNKCKDAYCDENNVEIGVSTTSVNDPVVGAWSADASDLQNRHNSGWNNQFAFPWEIGLYWNLTTQHYSVDNMNAQRPIGCTGLDEPFGTVQPFEPNWPYRNSNSDIFGSPAMKCGLNTYVPVGERKAMHQIVDEFASNNTYWAEKFLEGWDLMTTNGYVNLNDGPEAGWFGYYSLQKQNKVPTDYTKYIEEHFPLTWTDPTVDPYICGHHGHSQTSCGMTFSACFSQHRETGGCTGNGIGAGVY